MFVANLPIAGNLPQNTPLEYKQRAQEFWALDKAIESGNLSDALKAFLLQQNVTNPLQTIQKYLQSGHDQQSAEQLWALIQALQAGDQNAAQAALAALRKSLRKLHRLPPIPDSDSTEPNESPPPPSPDRPPASDHQLDTLA